jgi:ApaG protein
MFSEVQSTRTEDVIVSVQTTYVHEQSNPEMEQYMFAYRVRITNDSDQTLQLHSREWQIVDAYGTKRKVEGEGVVGKQPILRPGQSHEYVSGCDFKTPMGQMKGYFFMRRVSDGAELKVRIPTFVMMAPAILN